MLTQGERRPWAAIVAVAACVVFGLAACSPSDQPSPSPTTTVGSRPTPTSTPSPTSTTPHAPVLPAQVGSEDAAVDMVRYFLDAYTHAYATGDPSVVSEVSAPDCVFCQSVITNVERNNADGLVVRDGRITTTGLSAASIGEEGFHLVRGEVTEAAASTVDRDGRVVDTDEGGRYEMTSTLRFSEGRWTVLELEIEAAQGT